MTTGKRSLAVLLTTALALATPLFFSKTAFSQKVIHQHHYAKSGDTRISLTSPFAGRPTHGFQPVRVTIKNDTQRDRNWRLIFDYSGGLKYNSVFGIEVKAGQESSRDILVPVPWDRNYSSYLQQKVHIEADGLPARSNYNNDPVPLGWPNIIISEKLAARNLSLLSNHLKDEQQKGRKKTSPPSAAIPFASTCDNKLLPTDWRAYIGYDALMIAADEWSQLRPSMRKAILEWNRFGGILQIYTEVNERQLDYLALGFDRPPTLGNIIRVDRSYGSIELHGWNGQDIKLEQTYNTLKNADRRRTDFENSYSVHWGLQNDFGNKSFNPFLVVIILLFFSVLVGPVNLFSFAKPGQRHRLFLTTPLISIVASLLVVALILLKDGVGGHGRRMLVMDLESAADEKMACITQEQISRCGVLLDKQFQLADSTFMAPVKLEKSQWTHLGDFSDPNLFSFDGDQLGGDWFQSRSEQAQVIQRVRPTRSRIELTAAAQNNQPPRLFSSLEFSVEELYYVGDGGRVWKATQSPIPPGSEITLEASSRSALNDLWNPRTEALSSGYNRDNGDHSFRKLTRNLSLVSGYFYALSHDPKIGFIETLDSIRWTNSDALVFGSVLDRPSAPPSAADDNPVKQ